jgi:integrase
VRNDLARWHDLPIGKIRRADVQALIAELSSSKAPATVRKVYATAGAIFRDAVVEGLIAASPCVRIDLPRLAERPPRFHTAEEVHALADAIDPRYRALILLAGYCGLRPSELVGLRVEHLELLRRRITVAEGIVEAGGKVHPAGTTKTGAISTYTMPAIVADELALHLQTYPPAGDGLVFPAPMGGPIRWSSWRARYFAPAVEAAGLGPTTPYALRHSAVSIMAASGATLHEAGRRVGHRSVVTTNRYAHLFDERDAEIAEAVDRIARTAAEARDSAPDARPLRDPSSGGSVRELRKGL